MAVISLSIQHNYSYISVCMYNVCVCLFLFAHFSPHLHLCRKYLFPMHWADSRDGKTETERVMCVVLQIPLGAK